MDRALSLLCRMRGKEDNWKAEWEATVYVREGFKIRFIFQSEETYVVWAFHIMNKYRKNWVVLNKHLHVFSLVWFVFWDRVSVDLGCWNRRDVPRPGFVYSLVPLIFVSNCGNAFLPFETEDIFKEDIKLNWCQGCVIKGENDHTSFFIGKPKPGCQVLVISLLWWLKKIQSKARHVESHL